MNNIQQLMVMIPLFIISVSFHEASHAFFAYRFGDDTAKREGRLTLNPVKHMDIFGTLALIIFHFGWAKPVPVDSRNLRKPNWQMPVIAAAGPLSNLILAIVCVVGYYLIQYYPPAKPAEQVFFIGAWINAMLCVFNLIPIPPLDGAGIIAFFLPRDQKDVFERMAPYSIILLLIIIYLPATQGILRGAIAFVLNLLLQLFQWVYPYPLL